MLCPTALAQSQPAPDTPDTSVLPPVETSITVIETISTETPAEISIIDTKQIEKTPGVNLDDRLRDVPGFSLFRRSSSIVAHPTTQGVSLRGIGSSGASRSLVLWDSIPVNDPFGGWVYWTQFPPDSIERIEISRGASTSVFGDRAMGGAISIFSREAQQHHLLAGYEAGNRASHDLWAGYSQLWSLFALSGDARAYTTDGYFVVPREVRGAVDRLAGVRFVTGDLRLDYLGSANRLFLKTNLLAEDRKNGTALQNNSTGLGTLAVSYVREMSRDNISASGFHTRDQFHSSFSAISADRNTERITFLQKVPAEAEGGAGFWSHSASRWKTLAGADVFGVEGFSTDSLFPTGKRVGGGTLLQHGVFAQTDVAAGPARFFAGARHNFTGQDRQFFSPSAGMVMGRGRFRARGSLYRSFRAPTLNELFREFRVGNAVTQANSALRPESLFGAELGMDFVGESTRLRVTAYRNSLKDLITNVTLSSSPNLIVRQRQNAAAALSRGVEFDGQQRWRNWRGEVGYLFVDSRFFTGKRLPQIPRHQGSAQLSYQRGGTLASLGVRSFAAQFEDELNQFLLPGFATVQLVLKQRLVRNVFAELAFENLLDRQYFTGFRPTPTIGAPRLWRGGVRWNGRI